MKDAKLVREKLDAALVEVTEAERALGTVLGAVDVRPRAEKIAMTEAVEVAFSRVRSARAELAKVRDLVMEDD